MNIFFDLDGPILDVTEKFYQSYLKALEILSGTPIPKEEYWEMKQQKISNEAILAKSNLSDKHAEFQESRNYFIEHPDMLKYDSVWAHLYSTYEIMASKYPFILVTLRTNRERLLQQLEALKIRHWFSVVLSSPGSGSEKWKIKVKLIQDNIEKSKYENCYFIGDTETDILAAQELNMQSVGVTFGIRTRQLIQKLNPNYVLDSPQELKEFLTRRFINGNTR